MNERRDEEPEECGYWGLADDGGAFRWYQNPETDEWLIDGLILYGHVDSKRLKNLRFRRANLDRTLTLPLKQVPTPDDIERLKSEEPQLQFFTSDLPVDNGRQARVVSVRDSWDELLLEWLPRSVFRGSAEEWFLQTAEFYRYLQTSFPSRPTRALAVLADVPFTTAVRWVRECRKRGCLPPPAAREAEGRDGRIPGAAVEGGVEGA